MSTQPGLPGPLVITIVLNSNRRADTLECLHSLHSQTYQNQRVIVLDNHSTDGSVESIRSEFPQVQIDALEANLGYAGNNNVGIKTALEQHADWILVLNEDTVLESDCLTNLVAAGEADPRVGIVGPMVYHHDEPTIIQSAGGIITKNWDGLHLGQNELDEGQFPSPHAVDWISGCAIMLRRAVIEQVGMLDERFFYYWEETEWCVRAAKAGWKLVNVPSAKLWHKGVQRNYHPKPSILYYSARNHLLLLYKHRAPLGAKLYTWFQIIRTLVSWSIRPKWRSKKESRNAMWLGVRDFLRKRFGPMPNKM